MNTDEDLIAPKQRWLRTWDQSEIRILALIEGYVVGRVKGCMPFICTKSELRQGCTLQPRRNPEHLDAMAADDNVGL